jgi:CRISPR/Cas system CSM-associated protein Csm2 small subunit
MKTIVARSIGSIVIERANAMTPFPPQIVRLLVATIVVFCATVSSVRAQDDADVEDRVELQRREGDELAAADKTRKRLRAAYQAQFARWVNSQFRTIRGARQQLEILLTLQIRKLTEQCNLTEIQQQKIELAGRGDIKHFLDRFDRIARILEDRQSSIDDLHAAMGEMQPLMNSTSQRIFGEDSLLAKTLASTLDPHQTAAREKALAERNIELHRAAIASAVNTLRTNLGLNEEQATRLEELLAKEIRPPRRFGTAPDVALVLFQASRISEDQIRPIFDDGQWQIMRRWMSVYIHVAEGERRLKEFGFVFDDKPVIGAADRIQPMVRKDDHKGVRTDQPRSSGSAP